MSTTQALADAVATLEDAAELYQNQNTTINEAVDSMQEQVSGYVSSARAEQGFLVINKNHHLLDTVPAVGDNQLAVGMSLNGGGDFFSKFATTMIRVSTGVEPSTRPPIARELLDAMGIGANTRHFSGSFNIFHIRRIDNTFQSTEPYTFTIPNQHVKSGQGCSYVSWVKGRGFNWGGDTNMQWQQRVFSWRPSANPGSYVHVDYRNTAENAELYLALPTVVTGIWPQDRVLGNLYINTSN